jgi:hypothetical protein
MGNERRSPSQSLLASAGINVHLYFKPILEEGIEMEIVVPFNIRNLNPSMGQPLERLKNGKVLGKWEQAWGDGAILGSSRSIKSEKKLEKVSQDHKTSQPLHL